MSMAEKKNQFHIYVGMALNDAPLEFKGNFQQELKRKLNAIPGVVVLDFVGTENGTALDVYEHDSSCVKMADLCLFVLDYPSIGLGMEIVIRESVDKPALFVAGEGVKVSRMLLGFLDKKTQPLYRYGTSGNEPDFDRIIEVVRPYLPR